MWVYTLVSENPPHFFHLYNQKEVKMKHYKHLLSFFIVEVFDHEQIVSHHLYIQGPCILQVQQMAPSSF